MRPSAALRSGRKLWHQREARKENKSMPLKRLLGESSDVVFLLRKKSSEMDEFPLPKASYATLKDKQLKEMLQEHDLPTTGDRPQWEQRHQR
jgi:hypothetical protein